MNVNTQRNKKIEPHVILHLRINQEDIDRYMKNKIQTEPSELINSAVLPRPYDADNLGIFTKTFTNSPTPANMDDNQFETLSITESEFDEMKNSDIFPSDSKLFLQQGMPSNMLLEVGKPLKPEPDNTKPEPAPPVEDKHFLSIPHINLDETPNVPQAKTSEDPNCSDTKIKLITAMCEFADANRRKEWIKSTSLWCRWCVHPFSGPPVAIPKWFINKTFFVSGCYCSYSCAAKHLFSRGDINENNKWKYYNLLHLLRKRILNIDETVRIKLAPPQETLQVFGGHLSIKDFRDITKETNIHHKIYNVLEPPMVSIVPTIEEVTYPSSKTSDMRLLNTPGGMRAYGNMKYVAPKNESYFSTTRWGKSKPYIPIDKDRMKRAVENLKVKRKAPLLDKKKTLLHYMNLQINKKKRGIKGKD